MMNLDGSKFTFQNGGTLSFQYASSVFSIAMASIVKPPIPKGYLASTEKIIFPKYRKNCCFGIQL